MAKNITGQQAGTVNQTPLADPSTRVIRGKNFFPQSFVHPSTCRYGEVDPCMAFKAERGDVIPYKFVTDLNTYTMSSPLKSEVNMYTAAFKVPMYAIYPRNWEIMLPIPNKGDDVPENTRSLLNIGSYLVLLHESLSESKSLEDFAIFVRTIMMFEQVLSAGSLFSKFNMHFDHLIGYLNSVDSGTSFVFDEYFDYHFVPWLKSLVTADGNLIIYEFDDGQFIPKYRIVPESQSKHYGEFYGSQVAGRHVRAISFRRALELLRSAEYELFSLSDVSFSDAPSFVIGSFPSLSPINIEPIVSYQLACSHFFTNSKVDFVYSAQLYRENMQSLIYGEDGRIPTFNWNGIIKQFDVFSEYCINDAMSFAIDDNLYFYRSSFFINLFGYSRSLRYGDYFTAAHPEPLAVGDVNAPVIDSSVNALDMTRKLQLTRLLNKVNISGPRIDDYLTALFGGPLPEAPKDVPIRLSLEKFTVSGFETNNTGALQASTSAQNITTTNLRLNDSRFLFEVHIDEPCWLVVVNYFDAHRIYSKTLDRFAFHRNRFDDFIPDMQFIGDQDVKRAELDPLGSVGGDVDAAFAYNLRNMEYKQRYSYASGGFIRNLPSWAFITDNRDGNPPELEISPEYIRSSPSEFDRFYRSLTGYSLGSYFHFITFNTNVVAPYRQMVMAPEILA